MLPLLSILRLMYIFGTARDYVKLDNGTSTGYSFGRIMCMSSSIARFREAVAASRWSNSKSCCTALDIVYRKILSLPTGAYVSYI